MINLRIWIQNNSGWLAVGMFVLSFVLNRLFGSSYLWGRIPLGWVFTILLFVVLNLHVIPQYWTRLWVKIAYGTLENYTCKSDYILPFAGKWCVFAGGTIKELSMDWNELIMRYAYFFAVVDDSGNRHLSDSCELENYYSYGKDVLAVSDGVVVKVCNRHLDSVDDKSQTATAYTGTADIIGNHIVIRHHKNEYSCVGNLMHDSTNVKVGDRLKQGDIIAKCGNSGYLTDEPCLHFLLQSSKNFNLATSLPIAFSRIKTQDSVAYGLAHTTVGVKRPSSKGNMSVVGDKTYIGRGLDVENGV